LPEGDNAVIEGIDVSHWQGPIDWSRVKASGVAFAWVKATEGADYTDPRFPENAAGARAASVAWGAYHFWRASARPEAQAAQFARAVQIVGSGELPPVLDVEDTRAPAVLDVGALRAVLDGIEAALGRRPMIYTAAWYWTLARFGGGIPSWFGDYPLWLADYQDPAAIPAPWRDWTARQYTSTGRVAGVAGNVDRNVYRGPLAELVASGRPGVALDTAGLLAEADRRQALRLNPAAALQRAIVAGGMVPTSGEFEVDDAGRRWVCQRAEDVTTGAVRCYYVETGDWANVRFYGR